MYETKQQITQRKIRNGLRKQELAHKMKVWNILSYDRSQVYAAVPFEFHTTSSRNLPYSAPPLGVITFGSTS